MTYPGSDNKTMPTPLLLVTTGDHQTEALTLAQERQLTPATPPHADLVILNANGEGLPIEAVRDLKSDLGYRPLQGKTRTVILCHLEQASIPAQNALLKTLEEPPAYVNLIAVTTNIGRVLPTIQSRCQLVQLTHEAIEGQGAEEIVKRLAKANISQRIELAEEYKDREAALTLVDQLIHSYHQSTEAGRGQKLTQLLKTKEYLQHNTNPQLTMESLFFHLR